MYRILLILFFATTSFAHAQQPERLWYYADNEDGWASLQRNIKQIGVLAPSAYFVDAQGIVWGDVDARVRELAARNNVPLMPLLVNAARTALPDCPSLGVRYRYEGGL